MIEERREERRKREKRREKRERERIEGQERIIIIIIFEINVQQLWV
jgi:hypothetical protein